MSRYLFLFLFFNIPVYAGVLVSKNYEMVVESNCEEGEVSCDKLVLAGKNLTTGKIINLTGYTMHTLCADGVTPCRFLGYRFDDGVASYLLYEDGQLIFIKDNEEILFKEKGEWRY